MIIGKSVFPGTSTLNQLDKIIELLGKPSKKDIAALEAPLAENIINAVNVEKRRNFNQLFSGGCEEIRDLIAQ